MRLILVRHGDAHAGLTGIIAGRTGCSGLTDLGRAQALALGFDDLAIDCDLCEVHTGEADGMAWTE